MKFAQLHYFYHKILEWDKRYYVSPVQKLEGHVSPYSLKFGLWGYNYFSNTCKLACDRAKVSDFVILAKVLQLVKSVVANEAYARR